MKRNSKTLVNASKQQTERDKVFADNQEKIISILEDVQHNLQRLSCELDMRKKINLDDYLPVKDLSDIKKFMNKSDGQFHLRREEFENYLYCTVTNTLKLKRPFESSVLASIFSRDFLSSHRWPGPRY